MEADKWDEGLLTELGTCMGDASICGLGQAAANPFIFCTQALPRGRDMSDTISFSLNGQTVEAQAGETIWQVATRLGVEIPHLCYSPEADYRADGNCRACMVEIEGERVLAASCIRTPSEGMVVNSASDRARTARKMVFEMLTADQPERETSHDPESKFWNWASDIGVEGSRLPQRATPEVDQSHTAMRVNLDACIHCNLCVRACREVQVNDVIGMAYRGHGAKIVFDFDDPMGDSTCVACGECVQACPTGALMESSLLDENQTRVNYLDEQVESVCPYCGVGCQITYNLKDGKLLFVDGKEGPANRNRLCVKGRFGFDYVHHEHRLTVPLIRKDGVPKNAHEDVDPANPFTHFREATWEEALDRAADGIRRIREEHGPKGLAWFRLRQGFERRSLSRAKVGAYGFRDQQCRSLHAALPCVFRGGLDGMHRLRCCHGALYRL